MCVVPTVRENRKFYLISSILPIPLWGLTLHTEKVQVVNIRHSAKLSKYPFGYPGDVFGPNSIPYYECAKCWALYPVHAENGTPCRRCGEEKSDLSPRAQPRAVDDEFDPTFVQKLEAKLDELEAEQAGLSPGQ